MKSPQQKEMLKQRSDDYKEGYAAGVKIGGEIGERNFLNKLKDLLEIPDTEQ